MIRLIDFVVSLVALLILLPVLCVVAFLILMEDGFPFLFSQTRMGKGNKPFRIKKFRTMYKDSESKGQITVGGRDPRVTRVGYYLRKFKIDELPQLWSVLVGDMSLVGPRPEVSKYVYLYPEDYQYLLKVRPGITSPASIAFSNENEILAQANDPEHHYRNVVLPQKIELDKKCVDQRGLILYFTVIFKTLKSLYIKA